MIAASGKHGFDVVDITTLECVTIPDPAMPAHAIVKGRKAINVARASPERFILCYDGKCSRHVLEMNVRQSLLEFAIHINRHGDREENSRIKWCRPIHQVGTGVYSEHGHSLGLISYCLSAFQGKWLLAFSNNHLEIRELQTGRLFQFIEKKLQLLSGETSSRLIIGDIDAGQVYGLTG